MDLIKIAALTLPDGLPARFPALPGTTAAATTAASTAGEAPATAVSAAFHLWAGFVDVERAAAEIKPI
jgi:hypothetical protein